jgi:cytochrome b
MLFRLVWGFVGPVHARFKSFLKGPRTVLASIKDRQPPTLGHSPLGALSVMALLVFFLAQSVTGLFTSDDILFDGPLAKQVSSATVDWMGRLHRLNEWVLIGLVLMHVLAIVFYQAVKKRNLTRAMITGDAEAPAPHPLSHASRDDAAMRARALVIFALALLVVGYLSR